MSDETIELISALLKNEQHYNISIYGGEPFLDIAYFDKCWRAFYNKNEEYFISTNGSFVMIPEKFRYVRDLINQFGKPTFSENFSIRISNTIYHQKNWGEARMRPKYNTLYRCIQDPYSYHEEYEYLNSESEDEIYQNNPFSCSSGEKYIYFDTPIDKPSGEISVSPSGRALKLGRYNPDIKCHCVISSEEFNPEEELFFNFDEKGNIGLCSCHDSGKIGNIRNYHSFKEIIKGIKRFRDRFRKKYPEVNSDSKMLDVCQKCLHFAYK